MAVEEYLMDKVPDRQAKAEATNETRKHRKALETEEKLQIARIEEALILIRAATAGQQFSDNGHRRGVSPALAANVLSTVLQDYIVDGSQKCFKLLEIEARAKVALAICSK